MRRTTQHRRLARLLKTHGLRLVDGPTHHKVVDRAGYFLTAVPGTPSCPHFAENTVAELVRRGLLPPAARRQRIR